MRFLDDPTLEWTLMFEANLKLLKWKGECKYKKLKYTLQDIILFGEVKSVWACQFMMGLWKAWVVLKEFAMICQSGTLSLVDGASRISSFYGRFGHTSV